MATQPRSVANSVCLKHPERPAITRCDVCFKPICGECSLEKAEGTFCSEKCAGNYEGTRDGVNRYQQIQARSRKRALKRRILFFIVLAALGYGAYWYFTRNPDKLNELKQKAGSTVNDVKGKVAR